ncbi:MULTISPECIES: antiviral reverse transcriptase Drt5 [unclassified Rhizobium]|uniref:antiviral reverse transcriptase Drt5 n=1 Tax=unclassified Rhizobium TaxID=2613769 RepID=UPI001AD9AEBA|nr:MULTISPECIES: antiviral reverse transcriptase Drt5 [unclassified Rhizobium]MBO9098070.1 hypothetical protein [Rhizobium sp. L58/93]MBO9184266.1 hypothetical protein [Rhizobium sp. E27B/91]QXZ84466.1 hypothetical protein J5287_02635 [Rhizobium sp. K1/93]QXZ91394.1 hypothetical protein J5280_07365 [Rhizobium sp. K15/93]QYA00607.1 hypothetical protein J5278_12620 [Rhizobium sp. B21/90]
MPKLPTRPSFFPPSKTMPKPTTTSATTVNSTADFYRNDFPKTLFPLKTNLFLIENGQQELSEFIEKCLDDKEKAFSFLPQRRVYAAKPGHHLRRTVKLDAVSEYFLYDTVYKNRSRFRKPFSKDREHFGYRFDEGAPISATVAYKAFKGAISEYSKSYKHFISIDVASYFNNIYHHDVVNWFRELQAPENEVNGFGQMLREINSGRSVDCLPQGLYPAKMIGNDFLRFVENYHGLISSKIIRFMDDIYLFSDNENTITNDFIMVQNLLGDKGLSVNPQKTSRKSAQHLNREDKIDAVKEKLLKRRRIAIATGYDGEGEEDSFTLKFSLTDAELAYVNDILAQPDIEEEDAELILTIMRDHAEKVEGRLPDIIRNFPNLTKSVYSFCSGVADKEFLAKSIEEITHSSPRLLEFQLFWFASILEDHLMNTSRASALIDLLYNHLSATPISRAKILEIPDSRYGLTELRHNVLSTGQSDWLGWSAAVGSRVLKAGSRNHAIKYFGNCSQLNHLIATVVIKE